MAQPDQYKTEYGMGDKDQAQTGVVTIPPAPGPAVPGSALPGQAPPVQWMPLPPTIPGCPPGLEYLTQLDQVLVHQQVELFEAFSGIETKNRYQIKNALGQQVEYRYQEHGKQEFAIHNHIPVFFAYEESDLCMRLCCGPQRGFMMHVINNNHQEVLRVVRPFQCCSGCCWCADCCDHCSLTIAVESPAGQAIGHVRQRGSKWKAHYDILDANYDPILKIWGPCCFCQAVCCTCDIDFKLMTYDETQQIGKISKQWSGIAKEWFTKADNFGIQFPMDLDVKVKGTLLGALFLIEFMFFEQQNNQ